MPRQNDHTLKVLIVEDLPADAELALRAITDAGITIHSVRVDNADDLRVQLAELYPDVVLSDYSMPAMTGMDALHIVREQYPDLPFIFVSGTIGEERAIEAVKAGATDYVLKSHLERLPAVVQRALRETEERRARQIAECELQKVRERLESILGSLQDAVWSIAVPGEHVLYNNKAMEGIYGHPASDFRNNDNLWREVIHPDDRDKVAQAWRKIYEQEVFDLEYRIMRPDGTVVWVRDWARTYCDEHNQVVRIDGITSDITARKQAELALARQKDLYDMLSQVNQAIVRTTSREELLPQICRIAVKHGHLRFASITLIDSSIEQQLRPVASYGEDAGYVEFVRIASDATDPAGRGPSGQAIRSGKHIISNDFINDPVTASWHAKAKHAGVRSSAAFPLRLQEKVIGTINLYASEPGYFTDELLTTLDEIATDVSFAMENILHEQERRHAEVNLRRSEERFRSLVEATAQIVWHADADGRTLNYSPAFEKLTGIRGDTMHDWSWLQAVHPDDRERVAASWQQTVTEGKFYDIEQRLRMRDGMYRWFNVHALPILQADGTIREWMGTCTDIHDRVLAERAARESRRQYQELVEESIDGIYVRGADGRFRFVNPAFCAMLGYEQYQLLQMSIRDILDREDPQVTPFLEQLDHSGELPPKLSGRLKHRDGRWVTVETALKRLPDGRVQAMVRDVSKRVEAEQKLNEEQQLISNSINSIPGAFYIFDEQGRLLRWNKQFELVSGYSGREVQEMGLLPLVVEEQRPLVAERINEVFIKGESAVEADLLTRDGQRIPYYFTGRKFIWNGKPCIVGVGMDISNRRIAEQSIQNYLIQMQTLSRKLLTSQDQERRSIAHELHDEVGATLSALHMGLHKSLQDAPARLKKSLQESLAMTANMLIQVRRISLDLRPSVLDDLGLLPALRWYVREKLKKSNLDIRLDVPRTLARMSIEIENTFFRVLQSATTNVLRHAHANTLDIHLAMMDDILELVIRDDGAGFDVDAARIRARGGDSLGVLAMEERVRLVGGEFSLRSAPGEGTEVQVLINIGKHPEGLHK